MLCALTVRNAGDPDEVVCFGFFDGTVDASGLSLEGVLSSPRRRGYTALLGGRAIGTGVSVLAHLGTGALEEQLVDPGVRPSTCLDSMHRPG